MSDETNDETNETRDYELVNCRHVPHSKWDEVWNEKIEPKLPLLTGIVFLNPNFARCYYVPTSAFRCDYEDLVEYASPLNNDVYVSMKNGRYDSVMQCLVRNDSSYVSMHVCSAALLLDKFCSRCSYLVRLSFHYYYLDENFIVYIAHNFKNVISINLENSIGISAKFCTYLSYLYSLGHLNLSGCDIDEECMNNLLTNCDQLESLNVSNNCAITGPFTYCK